jgi:3-methylcrotonyl-CoA carboxylase alpha subunit
VELRRELEAGRVRIASGDRVRDVRVEPDAARIDGERKEIRSSISGEERILEVDGRRHVVWAARSGERAFVWCDGDVFEFVRLARGARSAADSNDLKAPMPGRIRRTLFSEGDPVTRGQVLVVLEAMKMEHAIRAPRDGTVRRVAHRDGELVEAGAALVEIA